MEIRIRTLVFADTHVPVTKSIVKQLRPVYEAQRDYKVLGSVQAAFNDGFCDEWVLFLTGGQNEIVRMTRSNYINCGYPKHFGAYDKIERLILTK